MYICCLGRFINSSAARWEQIAYLNSLFRHWRASTTLLGAMHLENTNQVASCSTSLSGFQHLTAAPSLQRGHFWVSQTPSGATALYKPRKFWLGWSRWSGPHLPSVHRMAALSQGPALGTGRTPVSSLRKNGFGLLQGNPPKAMQSAVCPHQLRCLWWTKTALWCIR